MTDGGIGKADIVEALRKVKGPDLTSDVIALGLVSEILVDQGRVTFAITVPADRAEQLEPLRQAAIKVVGELPGVRDVVAVLTAERAGKPEPMRIQSPRPDMPRSGTPSVPSSAQMAPSAEGGLADVGAVIAVASGKGGVGKSTTSVNIALGLAASGARVGILDADIYGPSIPRLLRLTGRPTAAGGRTLKPMSSYGLKAMSMGFLVDEDTPMIWRGPMVISAITQMLNEVAWGTLDMMVVDMPPGTGDAQLTLAQQVPLSGAVIVSTPQDLALIDARKALNMFRKVDVPVLGFVENMSYYICSHCGQTDDLFGHGGTRREAERIGVPFLGEVPLHVDIRRNSDAGTPIVVAQPESPHAKAYCAIADRVIGRLEAERARGGAKPPPRIVVS